MKANTISESRTSVALTKETIAKLKVFCKSNNLKMYEAVDAMIDLMLASDDYQKEVVNMTKLRSVEKKDGRDIFSQRVAKLPKPLQTKLKSMTPDQLQKLLELAEL